MGERKNGMHDPTEPRSLVELMEEEPPDEPCWIDPYVLPKGGVFLLGGEGKVGKSLIALELARALATGTRPFDSSLFTIREPARVLLCEQEVGMRSLRERSIIAFSRHKWSAVKENLFYLSQVPNLQLSSDEGRQILFDACVKVQPNVVVLDPISKMHGYEENSNTEIAELFRRLAILRSEFSHTGLALILTHHFRKKSNSDSHDPLDKYNFSGSRKWVDDPDTIATVHRYKEIKDKAGRVESWFIRSSWTLRHGKPLPNLELFLKPEDTDGPVTFHAVEGDTSALPRTTLPKLDRVEKKEKSTPLRRVVNISGEEI